MLPLTTQRKWSNNEEHIMERRSFLHSAGAAGVGAVVAASTTVATAQTGGQSTLALPATGVLQGTNTALIGTFSPTRALTGAGGALLIEGLLNLAGGSVNIVNQLVRLPVTSQQAACDILHLDLGPLTLNLLGLQITLSRVVLDIRAIPGAGLLGDLLCAIANLLSGGGALGRLTQLLNQLLGLFTR